MELVGAGPPSGPIFQPGLVELTSLWRDVTADGEPLNSFMHIGGPAPAQPSRDTAAQQMGSWARIFQRARRIVAKSCSLHSAHQKHQSARLCLYVPGWSARHQGPPLLGSPMLGSRGLEQGV